MRKTLPEVSPGKCGILFPVFCFAFLVVFRMLIVFAAFVARDATGLVPVVVAILLMDERRVLTTESPPLKVVEILEVGWLL